MHTNPSTIVIMKRKGDKRINKRHIKKGDMVKVIAGADRGKEGRILSIVTSKDRAFVEGIQIVTKHTKPTNENPKGGIIKKEAAVHISNLMVIDPKAGEPTRVGRKLNDKGKRVRYAKRSGQLID